MDDTVQRQQANKQAIIALMNDPRYKLCLGFYPDIYATDKFGYKEKFLLPQLSWKITELRIHPVGITETSHWRLSLKTADDKRTFFNNSVEYLCNGYGQVRIGPGADQWGPASDGSTNPVDVSFTLELTGEHTLADFVNAMLCPTAYEPDGVYDQQPMCWFYYTGYMRNSNRECRHWVQATARAFWRANLITADPTALFDAKNNEFGYREKEIPKGKFFDHRPGTVEGDIEFKTGDGKGMDEQRALGLLFPDWH